MNTVAASTIRVIVTGASGMVGEGVVLTCLESPEISAVLVIGRRPCGINHPKLRELLHPDFFDISPVESSLAGYDACFFCLGVTSLGKKEADYYRYTYTLTMHFAEVVCRQNPGMTFCYISGAGTDSSEKGKLMWARVKGKTENDLQQLPFRQVFLFRPGILEPVKGSRHTLGIYRYFSWLFPLVRLLAPGRICTLRQLGTAMIAVAQKGYFTPVIEVSDMQKLSRTV